MIAILPFGIDPNVQGEFLQIVKKTAFDFYIVLAVIRHNYPMPIELADKLCGNQALKLT